MTTPTPISGPTLPVVFHAPLKAPDHPTPSGDRTVARLFLAALERIGFAPWLARDPRSRDGAGDAAIQDRLIALGTREAERLIARFSALSPGERPRMWFTYHLYYKAPDLVGPAVARALDIPYVVAEASRSPKRLEGPWARFAALAEAAIDQAQLVLCPTGRDYPALDAARPEGQRILMVPPFLDPPSSPPARRPRDPAEVPRLVPRLVTVAMTRPGAKLASYTLLAEALDALRDRDWSLTIIGGGSAEGEVRALFAPFGERVRFPGVLPPEAIQAHLAEADLFVWPGLDEAFGMVYLEAQAQELPALACDGPGVRAVVSEAAGHPLPATNAGAFAETLGHILDRADSLPDHGRAARARVLETHSLDGVARLLAPVLRPLAEGSAP